ncbi:SpoIIE family protein phosphatase [Streptomyces sp. NPDC058877]|uniref:ATP-binding SpoIIE family protein phosphatase n=1 Tax=unclassified Streptomyces TaxID=2593676 RepID=UPI00368580EC
MTFCPPPGRAHRSGPHHEVRPSAPETGQHRPTGSPSRPGRRIMDREKTCRTYRGRQATDGRTEDPHPPAPRPRHAGERRVSAMSPADRKPLVERPRPSPDPLDTAPHGRLMSTAIREALSALDAVTGIVYLLDRDHRWLRATLIGGSPPVVFTMPEQIALDAPYASSTAWRTGTVTVIGEPEIRADDPGLARLVPFPYSVASTPLESGDHRFGALTLIRLPTHHGALDTAKRHRLRTIGDRLADGLAAYAGHGPLPDPPLHPVVFPVEPARKPAHPEPIGGWGLPEIPGSYGTTLMYHLHKLSEALNQAGDPHAVADAARARIMEPYRARSLVITGFGDGRLWVTAHHGTSVGALRSIHGASADGPSPYADALRSRDLLLFPDRAELLSAHPDAPDDGCRAWAYLPLRAGDVPVGVCVLGFAEERRFTPEEQATAMMMASLLAQALERVKLDERKHALAESVQKWLLPRILGDLPDMVTTARYLPAASTSGIGGDWYDVITLPDRKICLIVGDVEGHNVESAVLMGQLRSAMLAYAREGHGPAAVLSRTADLLAELETELLATCCCVRVDAAQGTVEVASAGHPPPLVRRPDGSIDTPDAPVDVPLGVHPGVAYRSVESLLEPGTLLLLYTDGLTAVRNADAMPRVRELLAADRSGPGHHLEELADQLVATLPAPPERTDDVVLLLARYEGPVPGLRRRFERMEIQRHDLLGVRAARRFVRESLLAWDREELVDSLELLASEVVTNALIHADSRVDLRLREGPDHIRLEVRDSDVTPPIPSPISVSGGENAQAEHGRGLLIVESLASSWGTSPSGRGKTVWLELPL